MADLITNKLISELSDCFEFYRELGVGGAARVFACRDRVRNLRRAVKVASGRGQIRRMRKEFQALAEQRHPNIVRAYDFGQTAGNLPYYTMEWVQGTALDRFDQRSDPEILALIAMQLLDALATVHARGWVHRDINPRNALVVGEGRAALVRLIDFGLTTTAGRELPVAGTVPYMAPEVVSGRPCDGRSDLYSLGVVLYEALVAQRSARTVEEAAVQLKQRPAAPHVVNPFIPRGLSEFVMRLLEPNPDDRYGSAVVAAEALSRIPELHVGRGPRRAAAERLMRGGAVSHRDSWLKFVRRIAKRTRTERRGAVCVVAAPTGVGKTPFLRQVGAVLTLDGFRVWRLKTSQEPASPVPALVRFARNLMPVEDDSSPAMAAELVAARGGATKYAGRLAMFLARAVGAVPTAIIVDDLHRADPVALEVLRQLAGDLKEDPCLMICAGDNRPDGRDLQEVLGKESQLVVLKPLTEVETGRLVAHRLNGLVLPRPALRRLVADSQGMPSLVERTLARLLADDVIQRDGQSFVFQGGRYRAAKHVEPEFADRCLRMLTPEQKAIVWGAAVLGDPLDTELVGLVVDCEPQLVATAMADMARIGLVHPGPAVDGPAYVFASGALRAACYNDIPSDERKRMHDTVAGILEQPRWHRGAPERVEHLFRGTDDGRAIDLAMEAAAEAAAVYADRRAIEYFARAYARIREAGDSRAPLIAVRLGRLFERTGGLDRAARWYEAAVDRDGQLLPDDRLEALLGLANLSLIRGQTEVCRRHVENARQYFCEQTQPRHRVFAGRLTALMAIRGGQLSEAAEILRIALGELDGGMIVLRVEILLDLAEIAFQRGMVAEGVRYARRAVHRSQDSGDPAVVAEAHAGLGRGFLRAGRLESARKCLLRALKSARDADDRLCETVVLRELGTLRFMRGELDAALKRYNRSLELARTTRARADESACLHNIGLVRVFCGDFRGGLAALKAALKQCREMDDLEGIAEALLELGNAHQQAGALNEALDCLVESAEAAAKLKNPALLSESRALAAWVGMRLESKENPDYGDGFDLMTVADSLQETQRRAQCLYYGGRYFLALGDLEEAQRAVRALRLQGEAELLGCYEAPALALAGLVARDSGEIGEAGELLERAVALAAAQGLRAMELEFSYWLGTLRIGTTAGAEYFTRAMELAHSIAEELPDEMVDVYLGTREAVALRDAFRVEYQRIIGDVDTPWTAGSGYPPDF